MCTEQGGLVVSSDDCENAATAPVARGDELAAFGIPKDFVPQR